MLILFDLDGTLIDSLEAWLSVYKKKSPVQGLSDEEVIKTFFFHHQDHLKKYGITDKLAFYESLDHALENYDGLVNAMDHVEETLELLRKQEHKLGILTARRKKIAKLYCPPWLAGNFEVFLDRDDATPKPSPDGVYKACELTGIPLSETVFVGDHVVDYECARAAGVPFIFFKHPSEKFRKHYSITATHWFENFRQLPGIISLIEKQSVRNGL